MHVDPAAYDRSAANDRATPRKHDHSTRIPPRKMEFPFDPSIPKHWFMNDPVATALVNGINLLFPAGERFFVRSVRHYLDRIDDPGLRNQIKGFGGQEGRHAHEHERFFALMRTQGFEIDEFLALYTKIAIDLLENRMPPVLNLAATAAAEHFTATMAENAFENHIFDGAHPVMREMLLWHASEEIEHKAVAYDVLQKVNPSYAVRMAGLAFSTLMLGGWWVAATRMLLRQEGITPRQARRHLRELSKQGSILRNVFLKGILQYTRRDFHPWDNDNLHLAQNYLSSIGRADA